MANTGGKNQNGNFTNAKAFVYFSSSSFCKSNKKNCKSTSFSKQFRIILFRMDNTIIYLASMLIIWNGSKITVMKFIADTKSSAVRTAKER